MIKTLVISILLGVGVPTRAADEKLLDYSEVGVSAATDSVQARQEATDDAVQKVSGRLIREMIGDAKFDRNLSTIKSKVIVQSDKYIPFIKTGDPQVAGAETHLTVQMKVSAKSLEMLLQQSGFLSSQEGPAILLPVVAYFDLVNNKAMKWWLENPDELNPFFKGQEKVFNETLKVAFEKQGLHVQDPQTWQYRRQVPPALQQESLRVQDLTTLAENFKSQLVMKGDVRVERGRTTQNFKLNGKFVVYHAGNGRVVADCVRTVETEAGAFSPVVTKKMSDLFADVSTELASQVQDAFSRGKLSASLIRLSVRGPLEYADLETLKEDLKSQVRSVRAFSERLQGRGVYEFDVDVEGGSEALSKGLSTAKLRAGSLKVESVAPDRVEISVKR